MADISKLEQQANLLMNNVSGWEQNVLTRIGKRIKKYGKLSLADVKSINNIATVKQDMDAITKELAKVTGYNISQIEQMYGGLLEEQHLANQPLYDYRGKTFVPFAENRELQAIAKAYARTTAGNMVNLSQIGGSHLGFIDKNGKFKAIEKMYTEALDKAVMQVSTGATDFHTAMRDTIVEMGGSGIRISYPDSGIIRRLDTAVRQSLLWGAKQASIEYTEMIGQELGCDGYEVDAHSSPRPSHMFVQGKQYCIGKSRTINGIKFIGYEETDPTSPDGKSASQALGEYGCLHFRTPILCGISEPRFSKQELAKIEADNKKTYNINGKEVTSYEATQMQRRIESAVRNEKTTRELAKASGDNVLVKRCNERIKAYQTKYNEISEITGVQGDKKRMSVPRGTASVKSAASPKIETPKAITKHYDALGTDQEKVDFISKNLGVSKEKAEEYNVSVAQYGGFSFNKIRKASYVGGTEFDEEIFAGKTVTSANKIAKNLEEFIEKSPKWDGDIYRGINLPRWTLNEFKQGDIIDMQGISSWSSNAEVANKFAKKGLDEKVIFHSKGTKQGTSIRHLAHYTEEDEVMISAKAKWSITNIEKADNVTHIYVEELEVI